MDEKDSIIKIKLYLIASALYLFPALIFHVNVLTALFSPSGDFTSPAEQYMTVYQMFGSGGLGLLLVLFLVIFVSAIIHSSKDKEISVDQKDDGKSKSLYQLLINTAGVVLKVNLAAAFIWFAVTMGRVGGDLHHDNKDYYVTYRGEVVKHITEQEFVQFSVIKIKAVTYLLSSFFTGFTGVVFLLFLENYISISSKGEKV